MKSVDLACKLLCASEAAACIKPNSENGQYNPCGDTNKQYNAIGFVNLPFVVTSMKIEAALVGKTTSEIIVAFRGTLSPALSLTSIFDWMQDLVAIPSSNEHLPGKVHSGFLLALMSLTDGIKNAIDTLDPTHRLPLYITGHSKGGGIAPIAAMYFKNKLKLNVTQTITFAGPNPGNVAFCKAYNATFPNDVRYENYLDIVPLLPPVPIVIDALLETPSLPQEIKAVLDDAKDWDYSSVGTLEYINSLGKAKQYSSFDASLLLPLRIAEIVEKITTGHVTDIIKAHAANCCSGYMNSTCKGTVCSCN